MKKLMILILCPFFCYAGEVSFKLPELPFQFKQSMTYEDFVKVNARWLSSKDRPNMAVKLDQIMAEILKKCGPLDQKACTEGGHDPRTNQLFQQKYVLDQAVPYIRQYQKDMDQLFVRFFVTEFLAAGHDLVEGQPHRIPARLEGHIDQAARKAKSMQEAELQKFKDFWQQVRGD